MELNKIYNENNLLTMARMPDEFVDCVVTSPPYYGLRDYGIEGQLGLESSPQEYIQKLVEIFREVRRVLKQDGTVWLNLGDSYAGGKGQSGSQGAEHQEKRNKNQRSLNKGYQTLGGKNQTKPTDDRAMLRAAKLKPKDLMMMPHRVAIALQEDGWYVRQDIVWHKPNPMPESVTDRCTKAHEYIFLLTKSDRYYFDNEAIKEKANYDGRTATMMNGSAKYANGFGPTDSNPQSLAVKGHERWKVGADGEFIRNKRSVWSINTKPFPEAHFATFPPELPELCIKAGCKPDGIVYDLFSGAGTTAMVAYKLGRQFIGSELNAEYVAISEKRLEPYLAQATLF